MKNGNIHVKDSDEQVWEDSAKVAKALGMSRSELIMTFLREATTNAEAQVLISDQSRSLQDRARAFLSSVFERGSGAEGTADAADECRVGV